VKLITAEERHTELVGTRLTKFEKRQLEAVTKLTGKSNTRLLREALNNLVNEYLVTGSNRGV
jgi:predicted DNA-binding protein